MLDVLLKFSKNRPKRSKDQKKVKKVKKLNNLISRELMQKGQMATLLYTRTRHSSSNRNNKETNDGQSNPISR
jgi:hypothetical protein